MEPIQIHYQNQGAYNSDPTMPIDAGYDPDVTIDVCDPNETITMGSQEIKNRLNRALAADQPKPPKRLKRVSWQHPVVQESPPNSQDTPERTFSKKLNDPDGIISDTSFIFKQYMRIKDAEERAKQVKEHTDFFPEVPAYQEILLFDPILTSDEDA